MRTRVFLVCILFTLISSIFASAPVLAASDFASYYKVNYLFDTSGNAKVDQEISLVNQTSQYYATEYSLSLMGSNPQDITAYDSVGPLTVSQQIKEGTTIITVKFNDKVVGKGKVLSFILSYHLTQAAEKKGNIWQLTIPKLAKSAISDYQLTLKVPDSYGKLNQVNPSARKHKQDKGFWELSFNQADLENFGIVATFGQYQTYDFNLTYQLENLNDFQVTEKIALPPDTTYQRIRFQDITPQPQNVAADADGNWLAEFVVPANTNQKILVSGQVDISSEPTYHRLNVQPGDGYLAGQTAWPTDNPEIVKLAQSLKTTENIYRYVVSTLAYDYEAVGNRTSRPGALFALQNPKQALCTEFTDLFIAIARAAGIPTREIEGFAFTDNPKLKDISLSRDILHSWPEYYNRTTNEWRMIDPTWENTSGGLDYFTKFDNAHFVFAIHGLTDSYPYPAGSYRDKATAGKTVFVRVAERESTPRLTNFSLINNNLHTFSLKDNQVLLQLANTNSQSLYQQTLKLEGITANPNQWYFEQILPYSKTAISFNNHPTENLADYQSSFSITIGDYRATTFLKITSLGLRFILVLGPLLVILLLVLVVKIWVTRKRKNAKSCF